MNVTQKVIDLVYLAYRSCAMGYTINIDVKTLIELMSVRATLPVVMCKGVLENIAAIPYSSIESHLYFHTSNPDAPVDLTHKYDPCVHITVSICRKSEVLGRGIAHLLATIDNGG